MLSRYSEMTVGEAVARVPKRQDRTYRTITSKKESLAETQMYPVQGTEILKHGKKTKTAVDQKATGSINGLQGNRNLDGIPDNVWDSTPRQKN